ncbi:MAG: type VI secretion system tip protein TssI/VgrG, partial [Polyangiaceae bacterium]
MEPSLGPITLQGPGWIESCAFRSMHVSEHLGALFQYELELLSDEPNHDPKAILGLPMTVAIQLGETGTRYFNGYVASLVSRGATGNHFLYGLTLRPWPWLLSRTTNCRIFQKSTVPDIVKKIFRDHGFSDFSESLNGTYEPREFVVQYRETDLTFVLRLLESEGIYFYFEHDAGKHTLVLCDSPSAHDPTPFYSELQYFPPDRQRREHFDHVDGWHMVQGVEPGVYALKDYDFEQPKAPLLATKNVAPAHEQGSFEIFDFPGGHKQVAQGERIAQIRLEELQATRSHALGESNARGLLVGSLFKLSEFPIEAHNRDYLVVSLDASISTHSLESGAATEGELFRCRFSCIPSDVQFRPARVTAKPIMQGVQTATIVGKAGEEIWTDEYARVKIKFPWDRYVPKEEENASCWVRVAQLWAGSSFGGIHVPRIG